MKTLKRSCFSLIVSGLVLGFGAVAGALNPASSAHAQTRPEAMPNAVTPSATDPTYADLATLAEGASVILRAEIRRQTTLKPERAPGLAPGFARLLISARTAALIGGTTSIGENLTYLVDVPLDPRGKVPKLRKTTVLLFANPVAGRAGELQLVDPAAQQPYTPALEARLRPILTELYAPDAPPAIIGISDALAVPGTLAGESETQVFLTTADRSPVSLTVLRNPGQAPQWGVSWGEIIDSSALAPQRETLRWYRLACALPRELPATANLASDPAARRLASGDYAFVRAQLGPCERRITKPA